MKLLLLLFLLLPKVETNISYVYAKETEPKIEIASWYNYSLDGTEWSKSHRTAASRDYPRGTMLRITNIENNNSVDVYVNDFGPQAWTNRGIDLSSYAFSQISDLKMGLAKVKIEKL